MVAAIVPTIAHPMFAEMVQQFTETMRAAGYQVMLSLSGYGDFAELDLVRGLLARRPDAMLLTGANHAPPLRQMLAEAGIPVVEIWDVAPQPVDMLVGLDHVQAGAAVAALFLSKGIDRFAAFAASDTRAQARCRGFTDAVRLAGGTMLSDAVLPAPSTITAGRQAMSALAPDLTHRTGLFCSSDMLAFGAITEARVRGIAVPGQLSVCGFGNFELGAANEPPFSTVSVEGGEIGRTAAGFLLRRLNGAPAREDDRVHVPFRIVERAST
jgi:LacI family gluconate utilization system Gnt-I transcriptional repressor